LAWSKVVEEYYKKTGEKLDEASARAIASAALAKLRKHIQEDDIVD
jgi:hypothetical protein